MIIYQVENAINGKSYVGKTIKTAERRFKEHTCGKRSLISRAIKKYGIKNFKVLTIDKAEFLEELNEKEKYWIKEKGSKFPNGYNLALGGEGGDLSEFIDYKPHTEETKKKISRSTKGKPSPMKGKVPPMKGKKMTEEQKANMKGVKRSEEARKNMSVAFQGRVISEETKLKIGQANSVSMVGNTNGKGGKGKVVSEESKKKMSESMKGRPSPMEGKKHSEESKKKISETKKANNALKRNKEGFNNV